MSETQMMNNEVYNHYLTGMSPAEFAEYLKDICPEFGDLNVDEVLLMQESAFLHIQNTKQQNNSLVLSNEAESSNGAKIEQQLSLDEELARALELGDDEFNNLCIHEHGVTTVDNTERTVREAPAPVQVESRTTRQDDIDPDRMTYEELQSLGESVGNESRGLSADLISRLPTFKYKSGSGLFSKKRREKEECVICFTEYKHGSKLTTLPCAHQYHSHCITPWLQLNKQCPICQKEVEDE